MLYAGAHMVTRLLNDNQIMQLVLICLLAASASLAVLAQIPVHVSDIPSMHSSRIIRGMLLPLLAVQCNATVAGPLSGMESIF